MLGLPPKAKFRLDRNLRIRGNVSEGLPLRAQGAKTPMGPAMSMRMSMSRRRGTELRGKRERGQGA
jgi:hypothetical protein